MSKHDDARFFKAIYDEWTTAVNKAYSDHGVFWAFNQEQFDDGYTQLVGKGLIKDGDKVVRMYGGGFIPVTQTDKLTRASNQARQNFVDAIADLELERAEVVYHLKNQEFFYSHDWNEIKDAIGSERFNLEMSRQIYQEECNNGRYDNY